MTQRNIDFGSFPNDPTADAIRSAFQKTQENFTELYQTQTTSGVVSINQSTQRGISVDQTTGNVLLSADFWQLKVSSTNLKVGLSPSIGGTDTIVSNGNQTLYINLNENTVLPGNLTVSNFSINSISNNITATGNTQITANVLTKQINVISSGNANSGVRLPNAVAGMSLIVTNTTDKYIFVYPSSGASINRLATDAAFVQDVYNTAQFVAVSNTKWYTVGYN